VVEVVYSARARRVVERLVLLLAESDPRAARTARARISEAILLLEHHPLIGRAVEMEFRELVISFGKTGYVALYDYDARKAAIMIHAVRHQREAGIPQESGL
jgi:plasmid stabilization system protein ParE